MAIVEPGDRPRRVGVRLAPRCGAASDDPARPRCGRLAAWMRPVDGGLGAAYFCDAHRAPSMRPVPIAVTVRRVVIECSLEIAGVSGERSLAQAEALLTLEAAIQAVGGRLSVVRVTSDIGRYAPPAGGGKENG